MILFPIAAGPMLTEEQARALRGLEPKEMPYGVEALFKDDSGNFFSLTQRR